MQVQSICFGLIFCVVMGLGVSCDARQAGQKKTGNAGLPEFIDQYNQRFEKQPPLLGSTIEDLYAFDEDGKRIDFDDFRGKYTVLTFGCLT